MAWEVMARSLGLSDDLPELCKHLGHASSASGAAAAICEVQELYTRHFTGVRGEAAIAAHIDDVNARGVAIDRSHAGRMREAAILMARALIDRTRGEFDIAGADLRSDEVLLDLARTRLGVALGSLSKDSRARVEAAATHPRFASLAAARDAIRDLDDVERLSGRLSSTGGGVARPLLRANGCATGRASPDTTNAARLNIQGLRRDAVAGICVRHLILPPWRNKEFAAADLAQIEPRVTAWLVGDDRMLDLFRRGIDVYAQVGQRIAPGQAPERARALGKEAVVALGYGMGLDTFFERARTAVPGIALDIVKRAFDGYHREFPSIAAGRLSLYSALERTRLTGRPHRASQVSFSSLGDTLIARLPTGRPMFFHEPTADRSGLWASSRAGAQRRAHDDEARFSDGVVRRLLSPQRLLQNIVQGIARDVLFHLVLSIERAGLPVGFSVHDEIVAIVDPCRCCSLDGSHGTACAWRRGGELMAGLMSRAPESLPALADLPLACKVRQEVRRTYA